MTQGVRGKDMFFGDRDALIAMAVTRMQVFDAAMDWWLQKRPKQWSGAEHFEQPTVNCYGPAECRLAIAVAQHLRRRRHHGEYLVTSPA